MKKLLLLLLLLFVTVARAADTELQDLAELVAIAGTDVLYVVDDPAGVPASRKITATNLFDIIDTFAELNIIVADETLVSEEGTPTLDALWTFDLGLTITTGDPLTFGINRIDDGADLLNGDMIGADTIDDDSIDWSDCTLADFDFENTWMMFFSDAAGDVQDVALQADRTFLESNGVAANPAFRALEDDDIPNGITIDLATLATTVTLANDDATNDDQDIIFTADAAGPVNLEADTGDFHYNPSTGTVTATEFVGGGAGITGLSVLYNNIGDAGAAGSISFDAAEGGTYTSADDEWVGITISNTQVDNAGDTELLTLAFTDDGDTNSHYLIMSDAAGTQQLEVIQNGADVQITTLGDLKFIAGGDDIDFANDNIDTTGTITATQFVGGGASLTAIAGGNITANTIAEPALEITNEGIGLDNYLLSYNHAGTNFTWVAAGAGDMLKATYDDTISGGVDILTTVDSTYASDYVLLVGGDIGQFAPKTDGGLTYDAATGTLSATQFVGGGLGGNTAWDDIADPDAAATIDFLTHTQTIDIGVTDTGGPKSGLILDVTGLGAGATDVIALEITTAADGDTDFIPIAIYDDSGVGNDLLFSIGAEGLITLVNGQTISGGINNVLYFSDNSDNMQFGLDGTDGYIEWSDGAFILRNKENGIDAIVNIEGKDAGEKGILRVLSDGDDKYIELYNDDTDAVITNSEGNIIINPVGLGIVVGDNGDEDYTITFDGDTSDGILNYDEDNADFEFNQDIASTGNVEGLTVTQNGQTMYDADDVPSGSLGGTYANITIDDLFILLGGDVATAGDYDFGGANVDLEIPQTSPAVPDVDGQIEYDFTDGKLVMQHSSGHAELGGSTDVALTGLIKSWGGTIYEPDGINDVITVKAINSIEFPHGVVITAIYLGISSNDNYTLVFENWDDWDTQNAGNGTIDSVAYTADASGEVIDTTPTFATIAAGQIIKANIPATDVDWIHFEIYYFEPAA